VNLQKKIGNDLNNIMKQSIKYYLFKHDSDFYRSLLARVTDSKRIELIFNNKEDKWGFEEVKFNLNEFVPISVSEIKKRFPLVFKYNPVKLEISRKDRCESTIENWA
jgi:hypothetical protein